MGNTGPERRVRRASSGRRGAGLRPAGATAGQELEEAPPPELLGRVAIVGFPNVGKSTLVNRLTATRTAVVHETPGVTRDRKELVCEWGRSRFVLVDTGGIDVADASAITQRIAEQARAAVEEADLVLFLVDARQGITPGDEEIADLLRRSRKPVLLVANKIDDPARDEVIHVFHRLGLGDPFAISSLHGHGTGDLLDEVVERLRELAPERPPEVEDAAVRVAILGRPNVGKSSLLNRLARRGARHRLRGARDDARRDRHGAAARRDDVRAGRHRRDAPQAQAPSGDRVLVGAAHARGGGARGRRARARRRVGGNHRGRPRRRGRGAQVAVPRRSSSCPSGT